MNNKLSAGFLSPLPITRAVLNDKERVFLAVLKGQVKNRSEATKLLSIRSTTISDYVAELLAARLLTEEPSERTGRGRPALALGVNANRVVTIVFQVISQSVHTFMVNLSAQIIAHEKIEAAPDSDNAALEAIFLQLYKTVIVQLPSGAKLAGIVCSLAGVFDRTTYRWIHSSRWPRMNNLDIRNIFRNEKYNISLSRTLDNELLMHLIQQDESTLLLHWGYGVGFAFGQSGDKIVEGGYAFGEIGHWHIPGQDVPCHCGQKGCLETVAALWSIGHSILGNDFQAGDDEENIATALATKDLSASPVMQQAVNQMATAASNVCRVFFPKKLVISGPFMKNAWVWQAFCKNFEQQNSFFGQKIQQLTMSHISRDLAVYGAAIPVLEQGLAELLSDAT
ncbi:ROK family protein [Obesumbacterium proteus]|nr:ROK family protein [Obesumbacterium proteus]